MSIFDDTRAEIGADRPRGMNYVAASARTEFFVHYDGGTPLGLESKPHSACIARVKAVQRFHMGPARRWSDTGYQGFVCPHGRAIEGRGLEYAGAHCPGHNTSGYGFQFMIGGNEQPTPAAKARMRKLYDDCSARSGRVLSKRGHRDGLSTDCPGDAAYAWVKAGMLVETGVDSVPTPPKTPSKSPTKKPTTTKAPAFPLPRGYYFGPKSGPASSVSGYYSHRADLKKWQQRMKDRGWSIAVDGLYGPGTAKVARQFQKEKRLGVDGLIGKATWVAAFEEPVT